MALFLVATWFLFTFNPNIMKKSNMYYDTSLTRINKKIYRPSSNIVRFVKSVLAIVLIGQSPVGTSAYSRKRF